MGRRAIRAGAVAMVLAMPLAAPAQEAAPPDGWERRVSDARELLLAGDAAPAMGVLHAAAEAGDRRAQSILGAAYHRGLGAPPDAALAVRWMEAAAAQGYPTAMHNLGVLFEEGMDGLPADPIRARAEYARGAALDYGPALGGLGAMMLHGEGGPADPEMALRHLRRGADLGDLFAIEALAWSLRTGTGTDADPAEARRLYGIAAAMGSPESQNNLGRMTEAGEGGPRDLDEAERLYRLSMAGGDPVAGFNMSGLISDNPGRGAGLAAAVGHCLWAMRIADGALASEWRPWCDNLASGLDEVGMRQAEKAAAALPAP